MYLEEKLKVDTVLVVIGQLDQTAGHFSVLNIKHPNNYWDSKHPQRCLTNHSSAFHFVLESANLKASDLAKFLFNINSL